MPATDAGATTTSTEVRTSAREAFLGEVQWTRFYAMSAQAHGQDISTAFARLLQSEDVIASFVGTYAGQQSQDALASLLHARAQGFAGLVAPARAPNVDPEKALFDNATAIARFFANLGPAWSEATLKTELDAQLQATFDGIRDRSAADVSWFVTDYDHADQHTFALADAIAAGMSQQYASQITPTASPAQEDLQVTLRRELDEHAFWIRVFIVDRLSKRNAQPSLDRAATADVEFGKTFASYFGQFTGGAAQYNLHIDETDATAYEFALEMGDQNAVTGTSNIWMAHVNKFATFLSTPPLTNSLDDMQQLWSTNVENERAMVTARFAGQWDTDATSYALTVTNLGPFADTVAASMSGSVLR